MMLSTLAIPKKIGGGAQISDTGKLVSLGPFYYDICQLLENPE